MEQYNTWWCSIINSIYLCIVGLELSSSWDACLSTEGENLRNGLVKEENGPVERCEPLLEDDCVPLLVASCSAITNSHILIL